MKAKVGAVLALLAALSVLVIPGARAVPQQTQYPGGRWEPPPATYGEVDERSMLTMPDGTQLETTVGYPTDLSTGQRAAGPFPVIFQHSPYTDVPDPFFVQRGYIFANVRPRGTGDSGGVIDGAGATDANDAKTIIPALAALPGANGKVGEIGCSFPGTYAFGDAAAIGPNSPLVASVIQCEGTGKGWLTHEQMLVGGVPHTGLSTGLCAITGGDNMNGPARPDCIAARTAQTANLLSGGSLAYSGSYYNDREDDRPARIVDNGVAVLMTTNWEDVAPNAALWTYAQFQNEYAGRPVYGPMDPMQKSTSRYQIIMGPSSWGHGVGLDKGIAMEWFDTWMNNVNTGLAQSKVGFHAYDDPAGQWINTSNVPFTSTATQMFLDQGGTLSANAPTTTGTDTITWAQPGGAGTTLVYNSQPLADGATLAGPMAATLYASSSNTNLQFVLSLADVAPDSSSTDIFAYRYANVLGSQRAIDPSLSWTDSNGLMVKPYYIGNQDNYLTPGTTYRFDVAMPVKLWSIQPGHSLRLTITTQVPSAVCTAKGAIYAYACNYTTPQLATLPGGTYTLTHSAQSPSSVQLPLLPYGWFDPVVGGPTPTSAGKTQPLDWTTESHQPGKKI
jgi:predicted acyl esterase